MKKVRRQAERFEPAALILWTSVAIAAFVAAQFMPQIGLAAQQDSDAQKSFEFAVQNGRAMADALDELKSKKASQLRRAKALAALGVERGRQAKASSKIVLAEKKVRRLLKELATAKDESKRDDLEAMIHDALTGAYAGRLQAYETKITAIKDKLESMENQLELHRDAMDDMVELRLKWLTRNAELGNFEDPTSPSGFWRPDAPRAPAAPRFPKEMHTPEHFDAPEVPAVPEPVDAPPAYPEFGEAIDHESSGEKTGSSSKIFFASEKMLEDGKITIEGITVPGHRSTITFGGKKDSLGVTLQPGKYSYRYEQDGELWGEGEFVKSDKRQVIEIETGEFSAHMLEAHKVAVTFVSKEPEDGILYVQGIDSDYKANEFTGEFEGELEFSYLPGKYIFVFSSDTSKRIQTFTVKPNEPMTVNLDGKDKD